MGELWGMILAAGESKRMKVPKMLLPFNGKTMIEKVIEIVAGAGVDRTILVLGASRDKIIEVTDHMQVTHCFNNNYKDGMLSSVKCGFRNLPPDFEAALVFLGDQPMITCEVVRKVISAYRRSKTGIVIPVYRKKRGHPVLIDQKYRDEIEMLDMKEGLRSLSDKFHDDVLELATNTPGILRDIDTHEDYLNEINQIQ